MDDKFVSFESMLAAQKSAEWALYSLWVSIGSLLIASITLYFAIKALGTWREQYKEDKKLKLVDSLVYLNRTLISMPKNLKNDTDYLNRKLIISAVHEVDVRCMMYLAENQNKELSKNLSMLRDKLAEFCAGTAYKSEISTISILMLYTDLTQ